jgi:dTDP-glucose pyrophosphorylase
MAVARNFLLKPTDSLLTAFQRVSANGEGFAAVVDDDRKLLGTFCDADGRAALLDNVSLEAPVSEVMVPGNKKLKRLPGGFVFENGEPVEVVRKQRPSIDGVVMAGGKGTRLRAVTGNVPKPLLSLGPSTILERILSRMAEAGVDDVWVSVNYRAALFKRKIGDGSKLGLNVQYLDEDEPLGNAGALSMLPKKGDDTVFITNADLITGVDYARMFDFHHAHGGPITMAAARFVTKLKYGVVHTRKGLVESMDEKPELEFLCNAGMYLVERSALKYVPRKTFFQMPDLMDAVRNDGGAVHVFPLWEKWVDAGSPEEFQQVLIEFATGEVE